MAEPSPLRHPRLRLGEQVVNVTKRSLVIAIVNSTPDSFYDRGLTFGPERALAAALTAVEQGADAIDVGGVPFSPDAAEVSENEEIDRVVPLITELSRRSGTIISVDTCRPAVAEASVAAGANLINDTYAAQDPAMVELLAGSRVGVVLAHSLAAPRQHHPYPRYEDVVTEVRDFLLQRVEALVSAGVAADRIVLDPGPDLNKNTEHTLQLLRGLAEITNIGLPTLVAVSNKDVIGESLDRPRQERVPGSLAATCWAIGQGARLVRTHNVAATHDAIRMTETIMGRRKPAYLHHNLSGRRAP